MLPMLQDTKRFRNNKTCSLLLLLGMVLFVCSCKDVTKNKHLPEKQMQEILLDIQLAEAYNGLLKPDSNATPNKPIKNMDSLAAYYSIILSQHKVTYSQFKESMDWYRQNPDKLDSIYSHIQPLLGKMKM